jgi:PTH1 family peptidyl-tRNA hydrolase
MRIMKEWLIVGLGNPGAEYELTRHNAGRVVVEAFHAVRNFSEWKRNGLADAVEAKEISGGTVLRLVIPQRYMNLSGEVLPVWIKTADDAARLIVVHDDIDIPLGQVKVSFDSGAGGHHGVESIIAHAHTQAFHRVRIGIAPKNEKGEAIKPLMPVADFVIGKFSPDEQKEIDAVIPKAIVAIESVFGLSVREI